jgi:hypothetical protein
MRHLDVMKPGGFINASKDFQTIKIFRIMPTPSTGNFLAPQKARIVKNIVVYSTSAYSSSEFSISIPIKTSSNGRIRVLSTLFA